MKSLIKREQGFTLIEIVIVIAIAAALILLVFLAVSGAQKSKRDQVRKTNAGELGAQLGNYLSNNGGTFAATGGTFIVTRGFLGANKSYMGSITDGSGNVPLYKARRSATVAPRKVTATKSDIEYSNAATCAKGTAGNYGPNTALPAAYAISYWTESGAAPVCIDNQ